MYHSTKCLSQNVSKMSHSKCLIQQNVLNCRRKCPRKCLIQNEIFKNVSIGSRFARTSGCICLRDFSLLWNKVILKICNGKKRACLWSGQEFKILVGQFVTNFTKSCRPKASIFLRFNFQAARLFIQFQIGISLNWIWK